MTSRPIRHGWTSSEIGYCSNVHSGESPEAIEKNIVLYLQQVRQMRQLQQMNSGLWISNDAARGYAEPEQRVRLKKLLKQCGIRLTTLNGFPYEGFHQPTVKANAYLPDWSNVERLEYTRQLAVILADCLPDNEARGTISTLPLGYARYWSADKQQKAEDHLKELATFLYQLEESTGKRIQLCLEMEPGCVLESTHQMVRFFTESIPEASKIRRYLGACYDVCHQTVMFEGIQSSMAQLTEAGIEIGKIQLSSALEVDLRLLTHEGQELLKGYAEARYLHQVRSLDQNTTLLSADDLSDVLAFPNDFPELANASPWRIHFHVPVHDTQSDVSGFRTTSHSIDDVFSYLATHSGPKPHLEVETYSWHVLPGAIKPDSNHDLIKGLHDELLHMEKRMKNKGLLTEVKL